MHYSDYRPSNTPGGAASVSSSAGGSGATASGGGPPGPGPLNTPGRPSCYDPRPPSRLSHNSYAQFNTFTRALQSQPPPANPPPQTSDFPGDCSLLDSSQLAYDNYGYPSHPYTPYRMGFAPPSLAPLETGPSYEMYGVGSGVGPVPGVGPGVGPGVTPSGSETGLGKYGSSTRFSYTSQHSDYGHRGHTQRMQTHV